MAALNPIPVGDSGRLTNLLNSSTDFFVFKNKNVKTISNSRGGPLLNYVLPGESNNSSIVTTFNRTSNSLYKKASPYTDSGTGLLSFGPSQPYVSVTPNSSTKNIKKYDSREFPIGSVIQDTIRIAKWSVSGKGILFYGKQFLLQAQAAHDETGIYNPLSVLQSTIRPASFGIIPRPKRHIDTGGGFLATLLSATGIKDNSGEPPKGTAGELDRTSLPSDGQLNGKGNIRAKTGFTARQNLLLKYGYSSTGNNTGGFLTGLISKVFPAFGPRPDQFSNVEGAKKYRADQDTYDLMLAYHRQQAQQNPLLYNNFITKYYTEELNGSYQRLPGMAPNGVTYSNLIVLRYVNSGGTSSGTLIEELYAKLKNGTFVSRYQAHRNSPLTKDFNFPQMGAGGTVEKIKSNRELHQSEVTKFALYGINYNPLSRTAIKYEELDRKKLEEEEKYENIIKNNFPREVLRGNTIGPDGKYIGKGLPPNKGSDAINITSVVNSEPRPDGDQIPFWFHDLVNDKYVQFRATVNGISDNDSSDWEEIKYLGRPDSVFNYKGYTRTINFSFTVYVNSIRELYPTWKKINYLKSMSRPSTYTNAFYTNSSNSGADNKFMVPPMVKLRIGDMYKNIPIAISSINLNVPDDSTWETLPANQGDYSFGTLTVPQVRWGQYPTRVEITITANILESEKFPRFGNTVFGPSQDDPVDRFVLRTVQDTPNGEFRQYTEPPISEVVKISPTYYVQPVTNFNNNSNSSTTFTSDPISDSRI